MAGRTQTWEEDEEAVPALRDPATVGNAIAYNDYYLYHELAASDRSTASLEWKRPGESQTSHQCIQH
jgi:hypothetical protein